MAFSLPKYQRQVAPSKETGAVRGDVGSAGAQWGAVANFADTVGDISTKLGKDYIDKQNRLKFDADMADSRVQLLDFQTSLELKKGEATQSGEMAHHEVYDKVVLPAIAEFGESINGRGYGEEALARILNDWKYNSAKIESVEQLDRQNKINIALAESVTDDAYIDINSGDPDRFEEGMKKLDSLTDKIGVEEVNRRKKLGIYNRNLNVMRSMTDPTEINEYMNSEDAKRMNPGQYEQFRMVGESRIKKLTAEQFAPAKKELLSLGKKGELTTGVIEQYVAEGRLPRNEANILINTLTKDLEEQYTVNEGVADDMIAEVDKFLAGKYEGNSVEEYDKLLEQIDESELPASMKYDLLIPIIEGQGDPSLNSPFFIGKKKVSIYDKTQSVILNRFRDTFNDATSGQTATIRMFGFGNGYREVTQWMKDNSEDIKSGRIPDDMDEVIEKAVRPTISNRIKLDQSKRMRNILEGGSEILDEVDSIWDEV